MKSLRAGLQLDCGARDPRQVAARLAYGSFVLPSHRVLFLDTPKAGSTTMKWVLALLSGKQVAPCIAGDETDLSLSIHHRKLHPLPALGDLPPKRQQEALDAPDFHRVCVVRNPYARLVSAWADKIRQVEPGFRGTCNAALRHAGRDCPDGAPTFREFVAWMIDTNDPLTCDAHWQPQANLLYPDLIAYNAVIRIESFREDLLKLLETLVPGGGADLLGRGGVSLTTSPFRSAGRRLTTRDWRRGWQNSTNPASKPTDTTAKAGASLSNAPIPIPGRSSERRSRPSACGTG